MLELWKTCFAADITDLDINGLISSNDLQLGPKLMSSCHFSPSLLLISLLFF